MPTKQQKAKRFLVALFESDISAPDFYDKHVMYRGDRLVGAKPWWPPLSQVWADGDTRPPDEFNDSWHEASALLEKLYAEYLAHKK